MVHGNHAAPAPSLNSFAGTKRGREPRKPPADDHRARFWNGAAELDLETGNVGRMIAIILTVGNVGTPPAMFKNCKGTDPKVRSMDERTATVHR